MKEGLGSVKENRGEKSRKKADGFDRVLLITNILDVSLTGD